MATTKLYPISAHLEPLHSSTPFTGGGPYSHRVHPVLNSKGLQTHRQKIVKEIFDTEHSYISQLNTVVTLYLKPIRVGCLLPPDVITTIFSNLEGILSVNLELFTYMRQRSLGEAFGYLGPFLKLYSTYANNFQSATEALQEWLRRSPDFAHFVTSQEARPECCGLSLPALLITPIQRIPRYKLLLEDLLKNTKGTHPDYSKLSAASAQITAVASHINEHIRQHDNFKKMLSIQNCLTGTCVPGILAPGRQFIREGRLMKVCRRKAKERMVFLFSDILIYARSNLLDKMESNRSYECRCVLPLLNSSVRVLWEDARVPGIAPLFKFSNADTTLLFYSQGKEEVFQWAQSIEDAVRNLQLAFGSLMNSQRLSSFAGDTQQNPFFQEGLAHPPTSPYPLTATIMSSHSLEDLSSQTKKRDSGFSEQRGTATLSENLETAHSDDLLPNDSSGVAPDTTHGSDSNKTYTVTRPKSSTISSRHSTASSEHTGVSNEHTSMSKRPHSASGAMRHSGSHNKASGSHRGREVEPKRKKREHKAKVKGVKSGEEGMVLMNEYALEENEMDVEVQDERSGLVDRETEQRNRIPSISSGSLTLYNNRSKCCAIL